METTMHTDTIESYLSQRIERLEADLRYWRKVAQSKPGRRAYSDYDDGIYGLMTWAPVSNEVVTWRHAEFCKPGTYYVFLQSDPLDAWRTSVEEFHAVVDDFGNLVKVN
jgi:hypothetical protein